MDKLTCPVCANNFPHQDKENYAHLSDYGVCIWCDFYGSDAEKERAIIYPTKTYGT